MRNKEIQEDHKRLLGNLKLQSIFSYAPKAKPVQDYEKLFKKIMEG